MSQKTTHSSKCLEDLSGRSEDLMASTHATMTYQIISARLNRGIAILPFSDPLSCCAGLLVIARPF